MSTLSLYLLRHGEPVVPKMFYGHLDVELSPRGRDQIDAQVRAMATWTLHDVHTSDLSRAREGAQALAQARDVPLAVDEALREMHLGELEGLSHADGVATRPELATRSYADMLDFRMPGGGESVRDVFERVRPYTDRVLAPHLEAGQGGERRGVAIYAHNTVTRVLLARAAGLGPGGYVRFRQRYGCINRVDLQPANDPWVTACIVFSNYVPRPGPEQGIEGPGGHGYR